MELNDVVDKLIGNVEPVGETHEDGKRLENLQSMVRLTDHLIERLMQVEKSKNSYMASVKKAGIYANRYLMGWKESLAEIEGQP
jgi:hypothetical protein